MQDMRDELVGQCTLEIGERRGVLPCNGTGNRAQYCEHCALFREAQQYRPLAWLPEDDGGNELEPSSEEIDFGIGGGSNGHL
jgi:hypothetical protein